MYCSNISKIGYLNKYFLFFSLPIVDLKGFYLRTSSVPVDDEIALQVNDRGEGDGGGVR